MRAVDKCARTAKLEETGNDADKGDDLAVTCGSGISGAVQPNDTLSGFSHCNYGPGIGLHIGLFVHLTDAATTLCPVDSRSDSRK
jgi:hypothetical protein